MRTLGSHCSRTLRTASDHVVADRGPALLSAPYRRIAAEEEMLTKKLGAAYIAYSQRTKRLIPFIW
jgi:hypothetical protein